MTEYMLMCTFAHYIHWLICLLTSGWTVKSLLWGRWPLVPTLLQVCHHDTSMESLINAMLNIFFQIESLGKIAKSRGGPTRGRLFLSTRKCCKEFSLQVCDRGIAHAFVENSGTEVAQIVAGWERPRWDHKEIFCNWLIPCFCIVGQYSF